MAKTKKTAAKSSSSKSLKSARKTMSKMTRQERTDTVSHLARELIKKGHDNERVFQALQKRFGKKVVDDAKRSYPAWYRRDLVLRGEISKTFAEKHAR